MMPLGLIGKRALLLVTPSKASLQVGDNIVNMLGAY